MMVFCDVGGEAERRVVAGSWSAADVGEELADLAGTPGDRIAMGSEAAPFGTAPTPAIRGLEWLPTMDRGVFVGIQVRDCCVGEAKWSVDLTACGD
mmetsp:Transcript_60560/g.169151  ORF Transcript_60560/g.169151 Transcript_60560/m.169151 type:complete len:96 (-) Transcript_60560:41-328(-)